MAIDPVGGTDPAVDVATTVLAPQTYAAADYAIPDVTLTKTGEAALSVDVSGASDPLPAVALQFEVSSDGGKTWKPTWGAFRPAGKKGVATSIDGAVSQPVTALTLNGFASQALGQMIRGTITFADTLTASATLTTKG